MDILLINAHPAQKRETLCAGLAGHYALGARKAGHHVHEVALAKLSFNPILHEGYQDVQPLEPDLQAVRALMQRCQHWVIVFPLWQALPPALLKGFFERTLTRGFAFEYQGHFPKPLPTLEGKSVQLILTCGMPAFVYRYFSGAHATRALHQAFKICGLQPKRAQVFGMVGHESADIRQQARYARYLAACAVLGSRLL